MIMRRNGVRTKSYPKDIYRYIDGYLVCVEYGRFAEEGPYVKLEVLTKALTELKALRAEIEALSTSLRNTGSQIPPGYLSVPYIGEGE